MNNKIEKIKKFSIIIFDDPSTVVVGRKIILENGDEFILPDPKNVDNYIYTFEQIIDTYKKIQKNKETELLFEQDSPKVKGKRISENDMMSEKEWHTLKDEGTEYTIITLMNNGKMDKDFYKNVKWATESRIPFGIYAGGNALNTSEGANEVNFILTEIKDYDVLGPIIYGINNEEIKKLTSNGKKITTKSIEAIKKIVNNYNNVQALLSTEGYDTLINMDYNTKIIIKDAIKLLKEELKND